MTGAQILYLCITLGVLQAIMQGIMFYNTAAKWGSWFTNRNNHKNEWHMSLFGRDFYVFHYFPFIMFTDVFHLAHGMFGMYLGEVVAIAYAGTELMQLVFFVVVSLAYSTAFDMWLRFMRKL